MWGLTFYSYGIKYLTYMTASFHKERRLRPKNQFNAATFYGSGCTKLGKLVVMYLCVTVSILFRSTIFLLDFGNVPTLLYFVVFCFVFILFQTKKQIIFFQFSFIILCTSICCMPLFNLTQQKSRVRKNFSAHGAFLE